MRLTLGARPRSHSTRPRNWLCHVRQTRRPFLFFTCSDSSPHIFTDRSGGGSPEELNLLARKLQDDFKDSLDCFGFFLLFFPEPLVPLPTSPAPPPRGGSFPTPWGLTEVWFGLM